MFVSLSVHNCVTFPRLPLACFVAQSPLSPLTHSYTIAALWPHKHRASSLLVFTLHPFSQLLLPTSKTAPLCSLVDISAITVNLSRTPDLDARLTGEPHFSPGCAACAVLTSCGPGSSRHYTHTHTSIDSWVWNRTADLPWEMG